MTSGSYYVALWSLLEASHASLQALCLPSTATGSGELPAKLCQLHFPNLRVLSIGLWNTDDRLSFTQFILTHDKTLEELSLQIPGNRRKSTVMFTEQEDEVYLTSPSFPRLTTSSL